MAERKLHDQSQMDQDLELWREQVRQEPGVVVHRPRLPVPFVPAIHVSQGLDVRELVTRDEDDEPTAGDERR